MCRCCKTCSQRPAKVSVRAGIAGFFLCVGGITLLAVAATSLSGVNVPAGSDNTGHDGELTGTLMAPRDLNCRYAIFIEKKTSCTSFAATAVLTKGATLDSSHCGSEELPDECPQHAPATRCLQDLDWTIGWSETKIKDLKLAALVTFAAGTGVTLTGAEAMWSVQLCEAFEEVFSKRRQAIIMVACGATILVAGLVTFFIGLRCCCACCSAESAEAAEKASQSGSGLVTV